MGVAAILVMSKDITNKISMPLPKEAPHKVSTRSAKWFQRRRSLKLCTTTDGRRIMGLGLFCLVTGIALKNGIKFKSHTCGP